jgi:hypothetical protein
MKYLIITLLILSLEKGEGQTIRICNGFSNPNSCKNDSVFKFYFFVFDMEISSFCQHEKYPNFFDTIITENKDTVYINKYAWEAISFMENISKVKAPVSNYEGPGPTVFAINNESVAKWKSWYSKNRKKIKWDKRKNKPVLMK